MGFSTKTANNPGSGVVRHVLTKNNKAIVTSGLKLSLISTSLDMFELLIRVKGVSISKPEQGTFMQEGSRKKRSFLSGRATKRGWGVRARLLRKKRTFLCIYIF